MGVLKSWTPGEGRKKERWYLVTRILVWSPTPLMTTDFKVWQQHFTVTLNQQFTSAKPQLSWPWPQGCKTSLWQALAWVHCFLLHVRDSTSLKNREGKGKSSNKNLSVQFNWKKSEQSIIQSTWDISCHKLCSQDTNKPVDYCEECLRKTPTHQ